MIDKHTKDWLSADEVSSLTSSMSDEISSSASPITGYMRSVIDRNSEFVVEQLLPRLESPIRSGLKYLAEIGIGAVISTLGGFSIASGLGMTDIAALWIGSLFGVMMIAGVVSQKRVERDRNKFKRMLYSAITRLNTQFVLDTTTRLREENERYVEELKRHRESFIALEQELKKREREKVVAEVTQMHRDELQMLIESMDMRERRLITIIHEKNNEIARLTGADVETTNPTVEPDVFKRALGAMD